MLILNLLSQAGKIFYRSNGDVYTFSGTAEVEVETIADLQVGYLVGERHELVVRLYRPRQMERLASEADDGSYTWKSGVNYSFSWQNLSC